MELARHAIAALQQDKDNGENLWWQERLGKCYYRLGMFPDAERVLRAALNMYKVTHF
jgi:tetratricopeptide (TPR) repeat protein